MKWSKGDADDDPTLGDAFIFDQTYTRSLYKPQEY